ncbi:extensin [Streptomyces sp. NPDC047130]|uniref:extensin n=1 Tax=Streptomyces sp. NPDC047130 TaxID=3155261 RepID=UPI00340E0071
MKPAVPTHEAVALLRNMTRVLGVVAALALVFTTVNVTRFATSRDVPLPIAVLLDPMIGTTLAGVLYVDARLASWGIAPPAWSTALRWTAGCTAALMNTWESLWPDRHIGWPRHADPAAVLLHLTPALLLIGLTETIAAYRRTVSQLLDPASNELPSPDDTPPPPDLPPHPEADPAPEPSGSSPIDDELWGAAVALDETVRMTTGSPVSVWRLRQDLRIGPRRAARLHEQLRIHRPNAPCPCPTEPADPAEPAPTGTPPTDRSPAPTTRSDIPRHHPDDTA